MKINMHFMLAVTLTSILKMAKHMPNGKEVQPLAAEMSKVSSRFVSHFWQTFPFKIWI